jgi:hypothetical protein
VSRRSTNGLLSRVEALERKVLKDAPLRRNPLVELAIAAMAGAWRPDEIEEILVAVEASQLDELPPGLRRRWTRHLDHLSLQRFGKTFGGLLLNYPDQSVRVHASQVPLKKY